MNPSLLNLDTLPAKAPEYDLTELFEAGCHFGHQVEKWNPKMKKFIFGEKGGVHIFDLEKTAAQLQLAYNAAYELGKQGKSMIVVGTKRQAREIVTQTCGDNGVMYIASRWLGGLLTNWDQVKKSLRRMTEIEEGLKTGKFDKYTKYERLQLEKEQGRLERFFHGIRDLKTEPEALFIIDVRREKNVIREANSMGVFTIGLVDSNSDPTSVDLAIPANDDGQKSLELIIKAVVDGYVAGKKEVKAAN
jgi:small subunit ribosomal protein S2